MPKNAKPLPTLTDQQKAIVETYFFEDPESLMSRVFPNVPNLNRRTIHWKAIRAQLALIGKNPEMGMEASPNNLTTEQQEFVRANYKNANGPVELARTLFEEPRLMPGDNKVRMVMAFIRKIDPDYRKGDEEVSEAEYQPPRSSSVLVGRLNRYGIGTRPNGQKLADGGHTAQEQKQLDALMMYLRKPAFKVEAEKFMRKVDREVFEETFMSSVWDKPDLNPEHIIQYVHLASIIAQRNVTDRMMRTLDERFQVSLEDPAQRLQKTEVEALKELKAAASDYLKQIGTLVKTLTGERAKIEKDRIAGASSMHPLVSAWKQKDTRDKIIALVDKKQRAALKAEVERFGTMDSLKAELWGIDPQSITY